MDNDELDPATLCARGIRAQAPSELPEGERSSPIVEPVYLASAFEFPSVSASEGPLRGEGGYAYQRYGNPNAVTLEQTVAALERGEAGLATTAGMAAITCAVLALAKSGDTLLFQADGYGGTGTVMRDDFSRMGMDAHGVDVYDLDAVSAALESRPAALLVETLSNPLLREADVPALAELCRGAGTPLVVDSTFATPVLRRPLEDGADVVVHSASKFLGGHHDLIAGLVVASAEVIEKARAVAVHLGATCSPFDAWLASRGIKTLTLRMERAQENARTLAARFREHEAVTRVHYPGWGPMLSVELASGEAARAAVRRLDGIVFSASLGGVGTTMSHSATSSHAALSAEERNELGICDGLLRLSVGIESADDLWADLSHALA